MYSNGTESLIKQAREIQESELQKFYSRLIKLLQGKEHGHETIDSLQRLRLIVFATKYTRTLPPELHKSLLSLLSSPVEQLQVLSSAVLRETLPLAAQAENYNQDGNSQLNTHAAAVLLAQLLRGLDNRPSEGPTTHLLPHTLPIVNSILTHSPESLTEDNVTLLSKKLVDWLRYASTTQGGGASSGGFFTGSRSRQPLPIAELDGTVSGDFFTVLCVGQGFTEDQWMNVYSFSMLRHWLLTFHSVPGGTIADTANRLQLSLSLSHSISNVCFYSNTNDNCCSMSRTCFFELEPVTMATAQLVLRGQSSSPPLATCCFADDRSEMDGSVVSVVSVTSSSSRLLPPKERLREKAFQYCQRLVEQSDRKAQKKTDGDLQKACLVEAVCILDSVCVEDPSFVYRVFPCIKALFGRLSSDLSFARVLLPVAQFYLNHGEMAAVDCDCVWNLVLGRFPAELFNDPFLAHELLRFLRLNLENVQLRVPQYIRHFPNLLKFLAWDSPAVIDDFVDLLPSMVTSGTALELLHTLLDLPCLSATLLLQHRSMCLPISDPGGRNLASVNAFRNPSFRGLFLFLLRGEAGAGDTIDRLSTLLELLSEAADWPRVVQCAQTVPILLHIFFNAVVNVADRTLLGQVLLVTLERSSLLLNSPKYITEIHRVFSRQLINLCKLHPSLVIDQSHELLEFAGATSNVYNKQEVYTHVVLVLGEYLSVSYDSRCSTKLITSCFETLEAVLFEITSSAPHPGTGCPAPRAITTLMSALAKLASRSHDLIPRVSLLLSKLRNVSSGGSVSWCEDDEDLDSVLTLGEELCALLKMPGVAQSVLNPPAHVTAPRWHQDTNVAMPLQLRALTRLTQAHASHAQHTPTSPSPHTST
ncbi:AP-5 complex subunit zeta-1 isoform X2 [Syngnathus acus]|uniref:AP-5 complex subunit zeta-1 isoform X2 n=1 Tax=Syngnathus acus TaxID=161584 RepID=UPI0018860C76|nr:AP-5 complex subunit zeta-1 isoform X2 [Syngnathus acus]